MQRKSIVFLIVVQAIVSLVGVGYAEEISISLDNKSVSGSLIVDAQNPGATLANTLKGTVFVVVDGTNVAVWDGLEETFNLFPARWRDLTGNLITEWSQILPATGTASLQVAAELVDDTLSVSNVVTVELQNNLVVDFSFSPDPPQTGPAVDVTTTSTITDVSYTYSWKRDNGYEFGTDPIANTQLGISGLLYGQIPFILRVEDSTDNISYKKKWFTVARPYSSGNPAAEGIPSSNGVALFNGNLHRQFVDMTAPNQGVDFLLSRSYNTDVGWRFNYTQSIIRVADGSVRIKKADGKDEGYFRADDDRWYPFDRSFDILVENSDQTFTLFSKGQIHHHFDSISNGGKLLRVSDRNTNFLKLIYDTGGILDYLEDQNGRQYNFTFNSATGHLTSVTDHAARQVLYTWTNNNLTQVTDVRGYTTNLSYDSSNHLLTISDPRSNSYSYTYDANERVATFTDKNDYITTYEYGSQNGSPATIVHLPVIDMEMGYWFDEQGRLKETINALNYKSSSLYNNPDDATKIAEALLVTETRTPRGIAEVYKTIYDYSTDGRGNKTRVHQPADPGQPDERITTLEWQTEGTSAPENLTNQNLLVSYIPPGIGTASYSFSYTDTGQVSRQEDPLHRFIDKQYNANGQVTQKKDARQNTTAYSYDSNGFLDLVTDSGNNEIDYTRDALGRTTALKDKRGNTTSYTYDADGNILTETDPLGGFTQYSYDPNGNLVTTTDPRLNITTHTYDDANQLLTTSVTVNGTTYTQSNSYDVLGRLIATTNRNNRTSQTSYDLAGNVESRTNPLAHSVHYTYDRNNNVKTVTDQEGRTTTYTYDRLDRVIEVTDNQNNIQKTVYNAQGLVASREDAQGRVTEYEYDVAGQLIKVTDPNGGITRISYDANGNQETVTDPNNHLTTYTYDDQNRLTVLSDHAGHSWQYAYDENGNQTQEVKPDGASIETAYDVNDQVSSRSEYDTVHSLVRTLSYDYDANGNTISVSDGSSTLHYTYDELNRVKTATDHYGITLSYQYDGVGNLTHLTYPNNKTVQYSYDTADRLQDVTDWLDNTTSYTRNNSGQVTQILQGNGTIVNKSYDSVGRLVTLQNLTPDNEIISSHQMTLDKVGNIIQSQDQLPLQPTLPSSSTMTFDSTNRILQGGGATFTHDPNGRIIEQQAAGETIEYNFNAQNLITSIIDNGNTTAQYLYDVNNSRVSRTINGSETHFVVDTNDGLPRVLAETNSLGLVQRYYIYGEGLLTQIDAEDTVKYYHFNPTGHTLALTDGSNNVTDRYAYTPYGHTTRQGTTINPFQFVGEHGVINDSNRLHYMRARYYMEDIRRFMSLDALHGKVITPQSLNRYAYVQGNPVTGIDPSGYIVKHCSRKLGDYGETDSSSMTPLRHDYLAVNDMTISFQAGSTLGSDRLGIIISFGFVEINTENPNRDSCSTVWNDSFHDIYVLKATVEMLFTKTIYGIGPQGTDCQEYATAILHRARELYIQDFPESTAEEYGNPISGEGSIDSSSFKSPSADEALNKLPTTEYYKNPVSGAGSIDSSSTSATFYDQ